MHIWMNDELRVSRSEIFRAAGENGPKIHEGLMSILRCFPNGSSIPLKMLSTQQLEQLLELRLIDQEVLSLISSQ